MESRSQKNKIRLMALFNNECCICGNSFSPAAMHFHHIDPETKINNIASLLSGAWIPLLKEADKCVLLCGVCHAEHHEGVSKIPISAKRISDKKKAINKELESDLNEVAQSINKPFDESMKLLFGFEL